MTNKEAKQQAIKNAYVEYWELVENNVDDNGWLINYWMYNENVSKLNHDFRTNKNLGYGYFDVRPKQIQGIENNNGWIRIESENDLPKDDIDCFFIVDNLCFNGLWDKHLEGFYNGLNEIKEVTHYKIIEIPKPPIY